ncbi:MAG: hypothetical protein M2R45_04652 [Verrucomicrobia subdivision 3 bacterium]|nr:hypothetical protein [Limisphaerales bacterium]MCS1417144.1 hypothetical protein [Limisphaerales bacterium]
MREKGGTVRSFGIRDLGGQASDLILSLVNVGNGPLGLAYLSGPRVERGLPRCVFDG